MRGDIAKKLFAYYDEHPNDGPRKASKAVGCPFGTASSTRDRWKRTRGYTIGTKQHPVRGLATLLVPEPVTAVTFEQILEAVPDISTLGELLVVGFLKQVKDIAKRWESTVEELTEKLEASEKFVKQLQEELSERTRERDEIMRIYNDTLAKGKLSHLTIDSVRHRIFKKPGFD